MSNNKSKIIIAIDEMEFSTHIVRTACHFLDKNKVLIHLVNVIESNTDKDELFLKRPNEYIKEESDKVGYEYLLEYLEENGFEYKPILYAEGKPADVIMKYSDEIKSDLIVLGSHNKHGFERFLIGSTSYKVMRDSKASLLVVKPSFEPVYSKEQKVKILTAIESIHTADAIATDLIKYIDFSNYSLGVIHVRTPIESILPTDAVQYADISSINAESQNLAIKITDKAKEDIQKHGIEVAHSHTELGSPQTQILGCVEDFAYDLIVSGSHGKDNIARFFMGSVSAGLYENCKKPVLIIKNIF